MYFTCIRQRKVRAPNKTLFFYVFFIFLKFFAILRVKIGVILNYDLPNASNRYNFWLIVPKKLELGNPLKSCPQTLLKEKLFENQYHLDYVSMLKVLKNEKKKKRNRRNNLSPREKNKSFYFIITFFHYYLE